MPIQNLGSIGLKNPHGPDGSAKIRTQPQDGWIEIGKVSRSRLIIFPQISTPTETLAQFKKQHGAAITTAATDLLAVITKIAARHDLDLRHTVVAGQGMGGTMALNVAAQADSSLGATADFLDLPTTIRKITHDPRFTYVLNDRRNRRIPLSLAEEALGGLVATMPEKTYTVVTRDEEKHTFGLSEFITFWQTYMAHIDTKNALKELRAELDATPTELNGRTKPQRLKRDAIEKKIVALEKKLGLKTELTKKHDEKADRHARHLRRMKQQESAGEK